MKTDVLTNWLNNKIVPIANRFNGFKVTRAITGGFRFCMPIIMIGATLSVLMIISMMTNLDPAISGLFQTLYNLTFGILGMVLAYGIGYSSAQAHKINPNSIGVLSISLFLVLLKPGFTDGGFQIDFSKLGLVGSVVAVIAGVAMGEICAFFIKRGWAISGKGIPDFIKQWFEPMIPGIIVLFIGGLLSYVFNFDVYEVITGFLSPLVKATDTLPGLIAFNLISTIVWFLGIHPMATVGFLFPVLLGNMAENVQLYAQGFSPTVANGFHINTMLTSFPWILLGGTGAFLSLNLLFLFSKVKSVKALGRAAIVPSVFCISEPILFGAPVAFNLILGLPMIFIQAFVNTTIVYFAMSLGFVAVPFTSNFMPLLPNPIQAYLANYDWRGVVLVFVIAAINLLVWYPFFRAYEQQVLGKEKAENKVA